MNPPNHVARWIAAGVSVFALAGAGSVMATTEPPDTTAATDDTSMASEPADTSMGSEPTGAGPSDCPAITEGAEGTDMAEGTEASRGTEADGTEAAGTEAAGTEAAGTEAAEATAMATETTAAADATTAESMVEGSAAPMDGPVVQIVETDEYGPILVDGDCFTLYGFTPDAEGGGDSTCIDDCAANWPPLVRRGSAGTRRRARPEPVQHCRAPGRRDAEGRRLAALLLRRRRRLPARSTARVSAMSGGSSHPTAR